MKRITILSTYYENIGDDLIRQGIIYQLRNSFGNNLRFLHVSKSNRLSIYFPKTWLSHSSVQRMPPSLKRLVRSAEYRLKAVKWLNALDKTTQNDLFVIGGTPVFYFVRSHSTFMKKQYWPEEIFERRLEKREHPIMIALGVGSILDRPLELILDQQLEERDFLRRFVNRADLITVRDKTTELLLKSACPEHEEVIVRTPCPSIWACDAYGIQRELAAADGDLVVISYSVESAGWDVRKEQAFAVRKKAVKLIVEYLRAKGVDIVLVSHNALDLSVQSDLASQLDMNRPIVANAKSLLKLLSKARLMVTWRVHGAMAALSLGVPTLLFKTDTRYEMAAELGATVLDDRRLDPYELYRTLDELYDKHRQDDQLRLNDIHERRASEMSIVMQKLHKVCERMDFA